MPAQKAEQFHAGRLISVTDHSYILPDRPGKTAYLLHVQEGPNHYFALYSVTPLFGHDRSGQLKPDSDIQYRISGKNLFLKVPDTKEVKGRLCDHVKLGESPGLKCGDVIIFGKEAEP